MSVASRASRALLCSLALSGVCAADSSSPEVSELLQKMEDMQRLYEERIQALENERKEDRARLAALSATQEADSALLQEIKRRQLDDVPDLSEYSGVQIEREKAVLSLGPDADVNLLRRETGQLMVLADATTFSGSMCLGSSDTCMSADENGALVMDGLQLKMCADAETADSGSGGGTYVGSRSVMDGQYIATSEIDGCAYGYQPTTGLKWECDEVGGKATASGDLCRPNECGNSFNLTDYEGVTHVNTDVSVAVKTGDPIDASLVGSEYATFLSDTTTSCAEGDNLLGGFEPESDDAVGECAAACLANEAGCNYFSVDSGNTNYASGIYCQMYTRCDETRTSSFTNSVYEREGCGFGETLNIDGVTWVCPADGAQAFPSEDVCECAVDNCNPIDQVDVSGVYTIQGYGSEKFSAYLDVDSEFGKVWMKIMSVNHAGSDSRGCTLDGGLPLSDNDAYSSVRLTDYMPEITADDLAATRFFCESGAHSRVVNFYTENSFQREVSVDGDLGDNSASEWSTGYTAYSDHSANLPGATSSVHNYQKSLGTGVAYFNAFFMYQGGAYHYAACGLGTRWECDDYPNDDGEATHHKIWVEFANPDEVEAIFQYQA